jgi:hypothetical protein
MKSLINCLFLIFGRRKPFAHISVKDLNRQQLVLDSNEHSLTREIEATEKEKEAECKNAIANGSDQQRLHAAKRIHELDQRLNEFTSQLAKLHLHKRVLAGVIRLKTDPEVRVELPVDYPEIPISPVAIKQVDAEAMELYRQIIQVAEQSLQLRETSTNLVPVQKQ